MLLGKLDELSVGDATSTDKDHAVGSVVGLDVVDEILSLDALDVLCRAKDGAAERLSLERGGVKVVEDNLLELLVNLLGLSEDNIALTLDSGLLELGVLKDIGENVDGCGHIGVEGLCVVDGVLALLSISMLPYIIADVKTYRCVGVEVSTHVLDFELKLLLCAVGGSLFIKSTSGHP